MLGEYLGAGSSTTKLLLHLNGNANDSSGNGNNGTPTNVSWVGGKIGSGSASFNRASGSNIALPNFNLNSSNGGPWTFSCWVKSGTIGQANFGNLIINKRNGWNTFALVADNGSNKITLSDWSVTSTTIVSTKVVIDDIWHCIIATSTGTTNGSLYVDGVLQGTSNSFNFVTQSFSNMIGNFDGGGRGWNGNIDEPICEARAWSAEEVRRYYTFSKGNFIL